jgi:ABC-type transport system involved in cytochrome c biogenesis permease subunit
MQFLLQVNLTCFLLSYIVALGAEVVQLVRARSRALQTTVFVAALVGLLTHSAYLIARFQSSGLPPLVGSSHDWLLVVAWLGVAVLLLLMFRTKSSQAIFLLPIVVALILLAITANATPSATQRTDSYWWIMLHASSLAVGIGLVFSAAGSALMYLLQYRKLNGRIRWISRLQLPNLERLTAINYWLVLSCYPLLTIGLITGFVLAAKALKNNGLWSEPMVWGTIVVWLMMTVHMVWLFCQKDQTGLMVARRTFFASLLMVLTIFGLTFVTGGIHSESGPAEDSDTLEITREIIPLRALPE